LFCSVSRYNANRAALVQSRIKALERMADVAVVEEDPEYVFRFPDPGEAISPPIIGFNDVSFNYPGKRRALAMPALSFLPGLTAN
jgi:ATP-binding cassette subfamily F protein 3